MEHFHPLTDEANRLGTAVYNVVPACRTCNLGKGDKPIHYWLAQAQQQPLPLGNHNPSTLSHNITRVAQILQNWQTTHGRQAPLKQPIPSVR